MIGWIILGVLFLIVVFLIGMYNGLVRLKVTCDNAWADIDVQLKRRYDLIPNLVETVKGYAGHERGTLEAVVQARNTAVAARTPGEVAAAESQLTGALRGLLALGEAYPNLKASANFQELQGELTDIENKIAAARRFFNNAAQEYNTGIQRFPAALFAGMLGFSQRDYFDLGETRSQLQEPPSVKF
jgi:LemA protein